MIPITFSGIIEATPIEGRYQTRFSLSRYNSVTRQYRIFAVAIDNGAPIDVRSEALRKLTWAYENPRLFPL